MKFSNHSNYQIIIKKEKGVETFKGLSRSAKECKFYSNELPNLSTFSFFWVDQTYHLDI